MRKKCIFSFFFKLVKLSFKKKIYLGIRTSDWEKNYCSLQSKSYANNRRSSEKCVERTKYQVGSAPSKLLVRRINRLFSATTTPKSPPTLQRSSSYLIRPLTLNLLLHINIKHSQTRLYFLASFEVKDSRHGLKRLMAQGRLNEVN